MGQIYDWQVSVWSGYLDPYLSAGMYVADQSYNAWHAADDMSQRFALVVALIARCPLQPYVILIRGQRF